MCPATNAIRPVRGPRWSRKKLIDMLIDCYGPTARNGVDTAAVAHYAGVSTSTVRRWIASPPAPQRRPVIPKPRLVQLQRGPTEVERRNLQRYEHALAALASIDDEASILTAWREQRWLDQHTVAVVAIRGRPWRQVAITNGSKRAVGELLRRAAMVSTLRVPTQFHAQVLAHAVMIRQQAWRVHPALERLPVGRTQVWMDDAPAVDLIDLARSLGLRRHARSR
jgi:hypothetical protein